MPGVGVSVPEVAERRIHHGGGGGSNDQLRTDGSYRLRIDGSKMLRT